MQNIMVSTPIASNMHTITFFTIFSYQLVPIIVSIDRWGASNGDHPSTLNLTSMVTTTTTKSASVATKIITAGRPIPYAQYKINKQNKQKPYQARKACLGWRQELKLVAELQI